MAYHNGTPAIDQEDRRRFLKVVGATGVAVGATELTVSELRGEVAAGNTAELATMGEAIKADLSGALDAGLLATETAALAENSERLGALYEMGFPEEQGTHYTELVAPGWEIYDHLAEVGFFESVEAHLPGFTEEHIESTARELIRAEPLAEALTSVGFTDSEMATVVADVVNSAGRLAFWVPTKDIPEGVEFNVDAVAPLHQRAAGGALLWIKDLDQHLWQKQYLLTEELLERGLWDVKVMLGGLHLLNTAAGAIAGENDLSDEALAAALTGSAATLIVGQEAIANDLFRITEDDRAPRGGETA